MKKILLIFILFHSTILFSVDTNHSEIKSKKTRSKPGRDGKGYHSSIPGKTLEDLPKSNGNRPFSISTHKKHKKNGNRSSSTSIQKKPKKNGSGTPPIDKNAETPLNGGTPPGVEDNGGPPPPNEDDENGGTPPPIEDNQIKIVDNSLELSKYILPGSEYISVDLLIEEYRRLKKLNILSMQLNEDFCFKLANSIKPIKAMKASSNYNDDKEYNYDLEKAPALKLLDLIKIISFCDKTITLKETIKALVNDIDLAIKIRITKIDALSIEISKSGLAKNEKTKKQEECKKKKSELQVLIQHLENFLNNESE